MDTCKQIAKQLRGVYFKGNWTFGSMKPQLADLSWQEATQKVGDFNTIAALTFHIHYFVKAVLKVLEGGPLDAHDKYSFDVPSMQSQEDWEGFLANVWEEGERCAALIEQFPDGRLDELFFEDVYGNYYRNFHGIVEHAHYHLGQIALIKKLIRAEK